MALPRFFVSPRRRIRVRFRPRAGKSGRSGELARGSSLSLARPARLKRSEVKRREGISRLTAGRDFTQLSRHSRAGAARQCRTVIDSSARAHSRLLLPSLPSRGRHSLVRGHPVRERGSVILRRCSGVDTTRGAFRSSRSPPFDFPRFDF